MQVLRSNNQRGILLVPTQNLDFRAGVMPPGLTFSRTTQGTRINASGIVETVAVNVPRFDYDPITMACKGLLIEESRTNLALNSENFTVSATWSSNSNVVRTAGQPGSPSGSATVTKIIEDNTTNIHRAFEYLISSSANNTTYTFSVFVRANGRTRVRLYAIGSGNTSGGDAFFDLSTGTNVSGSTNFTITKVVGGWYRLTAALTTGAPSTAPGFRLELVQSGTTINYAGDGISGVDLWGGQLEQGAFATSYIPTTTAAVTRAADVCTMPGMSSWFNTNAGTFVVEYQGGRSTGQDYRGTVISTGVNAFLGGRGAGNLVESWNGGSTLSAPTSTNDYILSAASAAVSYDNAAQSGTIAVRGANPQTNSYTGSYAGSTLYIGYRSNSSQWINGYIRQIRYYPRRLPNSTLQLLTQ